MTTARHETIESGAKSISTSYTVPGRLHAASYPIAPFIEPLHESTAVFS